MTMGVFLLAQLGVVANNVTNLSLGTIGWQTKLL